MRNNYYISAMLYAILGLVAAIALFLLFRNDHDDSYNRGETVRKKARNTRFVSEVGKAFDEARNDLKTELQELLDTEDEVLEDEEEQDLSFLDDVEYFENLEEDTETFDISGLRYHCNVYDCGTVTGIVKPDPSDIHDSRAQAVVRSDGKLLGYIPRTQLDWYEEFNERNVICPFVGEIEMDRTKSTLTGEIKVILPASREFVEEEIEDGL